MNQQETRRIVVGLDCSVHDEVVLDMAMAEAARRAATLRVVHAIEITLLDIKSIGQDELGARTDQAARTRTVRSELENQVAAAVRSRAVPIPIEYRIERGDPATCLLGAARDADLIVTGTRSSGTGSSPLHLGMVSQDVAVHASCPVLLVPPKV